MNERLRDTDVQTRSSPDCLCAIDDGFDTRSFWLRLKSNLDEKKLADGGGWVHLIQLGRRIVGPWFVNTAIPVDPVHRVALHQPAEALWS